jgi:hypothetical protein
VTLGSPLALDEKDDSGMVAVVPIGLVVLAGPGTISLVVTVLDDT